MDNPQASSEDSRLDRLEKKESVLEAEISRLDQEEKDLERRLTELELKELELAKEVSRLTQVKNRRPEFLMNYMKSAKKRATVFGSASSPLPSPAPAVMGAQPPAPETKPAPAPPQPAAPPAVSAAKPADDPAAASAQTLLPPHIEDKKPKVEEKSERKQILEAQIKNVLKKQELQKKEEQHKQEVLDAKAPIRKLNLEGKMSESAGLFRLLLSKGAMTFDEAGKILQADKDMISKAAKDLEDSGLVEINRPLYGSPKIRLKSLTEGLKEGVDKPLEKK